MSVAADEAVIATKTGVNDRAVGFILTRRLWCHLSRRPTPKDFSRYQALAKAQDKVLFGGRLGEYRYYDMDKVVAAALDLCAKTLS